MTFFRIAAVILFGISPAWAETPPDAPPADPNGATIRGDIKTGFLDTTETRVVAMDGQLLYGRIEPCKLVPLAPGPHSLVVAYDGRHLPLRIDARAGASYALLFRDGHPDVVVVTDEKTNEVVAEIPDDGEQTQTPSYVEPSAPDLATVEADSESHVKLLAVDGAFVTPRSAAVRVAPGPRAIAVSSNEFLGVGGNYTEMTAWTRFPLLLDVLPGATYRIRYERPKDAPILGPIMRTVWIEDATHGAVISKTTIPLNVNAEARSVVAGVPLDQKVDFPEGKGQLKRTAPKPKPWCQHD